MRVAGYLVGFDDRGQVCHLVVDHLPPAARPAASAHLLHREMRSAEQVYDLLIETDDLVAPFLCLPALPPEVVDHLKAREVVTVLELATMEPLQLNVRLSLGI